MSQSTAKYQHRIPQNIDQNDNTDMNFTTV